LESRWLLSASPVARATVIDINLGLTVSGSINLTTAAEALSDITTKGLSLNAQALAGVVSNPSTLATYAKQFGVTDLVITTSATGLSTLTAPPTVPIVPILIGHKPLLPQVQIANPAPGEYTFDASLSISGGHSAPGATVDASFVITIGANNTATFCFTLTATIGGSK
jgi:hypothetical protein